MSRRRTRFFIGLTEIGGYYAGLQAGLEAIGHEALMVNFSPHPFGRERWRGRAPLVARTAVLVAERRGGVAERRRAAATAWRLASIVSRVALLAWALLRFDVFVFGFGTTFFAYRELALLRLLRKRIVYVFHGSDHRPTYLDGSEMAPDRGLSVADCIAWTAAKKERIRRIERHAHVVVGNPLSAHLHERPLVPFAQIGMPLAPSGVPPSRSGGAVRVLHAPSHAAAKGTDRIRAEVAGLAAEGAAIEYTELAGVPHADVLDALDRADVVVDQLYSDVAMAAFAAEAAAHGVPAVVGSYAVAELRAAAEPLPPTVLCRPDEFAATLARLIDGADERRRHGDAARAFVLERLSPQAVARRFVEAVEDPAAATFDPAGLRYCHGACLSEDRARSIVRAVVEAGGKQALCVGDKPGLERALIAFALAQPDAGGGEAAGAPRTSS